MASLKVVLRSGSEEEECRIEEVVDGRNLGYQEKGQRSTNAAQWVNTFVRRAARGAALVEESMARVAAQGIARSTDRYGFYRISMKSVPIYDTTVSLRSELISGNMATVQLLSI